MELFKSRGCRRKFSGQNMEQNMKKKKEKKNKIWDFHEKISEFIILSSKLS